MRRVVGWLVAGVLVLALAGCGGVDEDCGCGPTTVAPTTTSVNT